MDEMATDPAARKRKQESRMIAENSSQECQDKRSIYYIFERTWPVAAYLYP